MPKKSNLIQAAIIAISLLILVAAVFFAFNYTAAQISSTNLFENTISNFNQVAVPVNYETRIAKGDSLAKAGDLSLAATEYAFAINIQTENPEAYAKLGETYLLMNDSSNAVTQLQTALDLSPNNTSYTESYGLALMRNNRFEEAAEVLDSDGFHSALLDFFQGNYSNSKSKLEKLTPSTEIQNYLNAFASYNSQKEGQDLYLEALFTQALSDSEEYELAENLAIDILNNKNDYRDVWILLGYAQLKMEKYQESEDAFKQAKTLDSVKPETHYFLATAHFFQEEYPEAVAEYELALLYDFEPEEEAYSKIAESQLYLENYSEALEAYEYLVKIDHSSVEGFIRPVWISISELNDLDRALTIAEESVSYFPDEAMSHNLLAWVYVERNELDAAQIAAEKAIGLDSNLAAAHYNAGQVYQKQGNLDAAIKAYEAAHNIAGSEDSIGALAKEKYNFLITTP
jgi:tetratricopeptide (TPR) repeat protein